MADIIPTMRYRNAEKAITWLCDAFGFEVRLKVPGTQEGTIMHAQLTYKSAMIMLGSDRDDAYGRWITVPDHIGGKTTQAPYMVVQDPVAHYERAKKAGAEIVMALEPQAHGGHAYSCRDPEGHLWNFGDYNPWKE